MSTDDAQNKKSLTVKELPGSQIEIIADIPASDFDKHRTSAIRELEDAVHIDGFRKGHIPESVLIAKVGESAILQETAELAIAEFYMRILQEEKIEAIGKPFITITKVARGNPLGVKIVTAVLPKVALPDYKDIAHEINARKIRTEEVTEKEVDDIVLEIQKNWVRAQKKGKAAEQSDKEEGKDSAPELSDEFVQQLGNFKTVLDFKTKIRENLAKEKEMKAREKQRLEILEGIVKQVEIIIPQILIEGETEKMLAQFKESITSMGLKVEDYFSHIKKSEEEVRKESKSEAEKRVKTQLVLAEIARAEKIQVPEEELSRETERLLSYHKDAPSDRARAYVLNLLTNEKVFQFLEDQSRSV